MRFFLDAELNGFCGELNSLALAPEDAAVTPFYEAVDCSEPQPWVVANVIPVLDTPRAPLVKAALPGLAGAAT